LNTAYLLEGIPIMESVKLHLVISNMSEDGWRDRLAHALFTAVHKLALDMQIQPEVILSKPLNVILEVSPRDEN
jgi:hypothetical protein